MSGLFVIPIIMKRFILAIAIAAFSMAPALPASACSCIIPSPPVESMAQAGAVFSGTVTFVEEWNVGGVRSSATPIRVRIDVDGVWKGDISASQELRTAASSASCGFPFTEGDRYLVYAHEDEDGLSVSLCSRTAPFPQAEADIAALGTPGAPAPAASEGPTTGAAVTALVMVIAALAGAYGFARILDHGKRPK